MNMRTITGPAAEAVTEQSQRAAPVLELLAGAEAEAEAVEEDKLWRD